MSVDLTEVRRLFLAVRDLVATERGRRLDELGADDPELRREVESLLAHHDVAGAAIEEDLGRLVHAAADDLVAAAEPKRVHGFEIMERLGEGGMGVVYRARQEMPERVVALKLLRVGAVSAEHLARFRLETHVLGRLQHPGIAQIFEAGLLDDGAGARPYFAMELVEGRPLDQHAAANELDHRDRVAIMIGICAAVHHAHLKGVIHRDLKPGNVLVTDAGHAKVLDFGVARATDADIRSTTLQTSVGQLVGTIPYMSPEQVAGDPAALDLRSDVYALGVVLYELLTGRLPYDLDGSAIPAAVRVIAETPATRLGAVRRDLRGDLETILATALQKEPARRYDSAAALGDDLQRYLDDRPIVARPPSATYQLRLFARRHRAIVVASAVLVAFLVIASIVSTTLAVQASRQRRIAERVNVYLEQMLSLPGGHRGGEEVTVLEMVDQVAGGLDASSGELPEVEAAVRQAIGGTYLSLLRFEPAERHLQRAVDLWRGLEPEGPRLDRSLDLLGSALRERGDFGAAEATYRELLARPSGDSVAPDVVRNRRRALAVVLTRMGKLAEAETILVEQVASRRDDGDESFELVQDLNLLAQLYEARGDVVAANEAFAEALEVGRRRVPPEHPILASIMTRLGAVRLGQGDPDAAWPLLEESWHATRDTRPVGSADWMTTASAALGCLTAMDDREACASLLTEIAGRLEAALGPEDFRTREAWRILARRYDEWGAPDEAAAVRTAHPAPAGGATPPAGHR